jgi:putative ABC transport system permease protein
VRFYRFLLTLLPSEFRGDFGDAMGADLDAMPRARIWTREIPSLITAIVREHAAGLASDMRDAVRVLRQSPGFTLAAILMLAVGTGANAAVFSVIDAVMLRPAFPDAGRIVTVSEERTNKAPARILPLAHIPALERSGVFAKVSGVSGSLSVMTHGREDRRVDVECVSASLFDLVGVQAAKGRVFGPDDDRPGGEPVLVISHQMWLREFGGADMSSVLGRTVTLNGQANTVIGVMPREFLGPSASNRTEAWAPLGQAIGRRAASGCRLAADGRAQVIARIVPPLTMASAIERLNAQNVLQGLPMPAGATGRIQLTRTDADTYDDFRAPFLALMGAVVCVLLIAIANVANLQLERLSGRRREMAVRLALGASHARIIRQTLVENVLLSVTGAVVGLGAAQLTLRSMVAMMPPTVPHIADIAVDSRALAATFALALAAGIGVGIVPALHALRSGGAMDLRARELTTRGMAGGTRWVRRSLVIAELALSVTLLIGAGLMVRTFMVLRPVDIGFDPSNRFVTNTSLPDEWIVTPEHRRFMDDVISRLNAIPGVVSASGSSYLPFGGYTATSQVRVNQAATDGVWSAWTSEHFMRDMGMSLAAGREFNAGDSPAGAPVAIVNETFARQFFPAGDALGQSIDVRPEDATVTTTRRIVGVLRDAREGGRDRIIRPEIYAPYAQEPGAGYLYFVVKTDGTSHAQLPALIRKAVSDAKPGQIAERIEPMQTMVDRGVSRPRFGAWLFGVFAAIAAGLSAMGLGAVIAWWVAERRREIGVRMALGAPGSRVAGLVVRESLGLTFAGIAIGGTAAAFSTRLLGDWLYGVTPTDPATFALGAAGMLAIAAAAAYLPARRAARVDPAVTLRLE